MPALRFLYATLMPVIISITRRNRNRFRGRSQMHAASASVLFVGPDVKSVYRSCKKYPPGSCGEDATQFTAAVLKVHGRLPGVSDSGGRRSYNGRKPVTGVHPSVYLAHGRPQEPVFGILVGSSGYSRSMDGRASASRSNSAGAAAADATTSSQIKSSTYSTSSPSPAAAAEIRTADAV